MQRVSVVDRRVGGDDRVLRADRLPVFGFHDDGVVVVFLDRHDGRILEQLPAALPDAANKALEILGRMERCQVRIAQTAYALVSLQWDALGVSHGHSGRLRGFVFFLDFRLLGLRAGEKEAVDAPEIAIDPL